MNREELLTIMDDENDDIETDLLSEPGCNAIKGLIMIAKYLPKNGIEAASHDVIYSVSVDDIIEAGISMKDVICLRRLNWMVQNECLACFV